MAPTGQPELWLGGNKYVPIDQVDRILLSGRKRGSTVVLLKSGERVRAGRPFKAIARDWKRLHRRLVTRELARIGVTHPEALAPLSTREAAELTGYPVSRLRRLIRDGQVQASKVSGRWVIDPGSLYLWVAEQT